MLSAKQCLGPDAVFVQTVEVLVGALALWGAAVKVLETLPGTDAFLRCLFRNVQFTAERQAAFGPVVDKEDGVTIMALGTQRKQENIESSKRHIGLIL